MRRRAVAVVSIVAFALLAACGDDGGDDSPEAETFCTVVDPIQAIGTALETSDPASIETAMTDAEAAFAAVGDTPPEGIASDVTTARSIFEAANAALAANEYSIDAAGAADPEAINAILDPEFQTAADNIQAWSTDNC
jgi:hypothetical protein